MASKMFNDRRRMPAVTTRGEVREHLSVHHGLEASPKMLLNDLHDVHDSTHESVTNHQHGE